MGRRLTAAAREEDDDQRVAYEARAVELAVLAGQESPRDPYDRELARLLHEMLREHCAGQVVADLGCGSGDYLFPAAATARRAIGIDFSWRRLRILADRAPPGGAPGAVLQANIRSLPLRDSSLDVAFSLNTLHTVPDVHEAIGEIARVLRRGGVAILEFGNFWSLHTVVFYRPNAPGIRYFHIGVRTMRRLLREAGLDVVRWRSFQLLPLVGGGPRWLRPLTARRWRWLFRRRLGSRMLDEIVSSAPPCRPFAFRHVVLCEKR
jgi:ubiquinone/menaquinone biosynthesis C-methylase UbiE